MTAATLLDRLDRVRETGPGRWIARCPAHEDRSPSLSIRELDDGRVLLHDFGGCATVDVLAAIGLGLSDLFEASLEHHLAPSHARIPARDLILLLSEETMVVAVVAARLLESRRINSHDWQRLTQAARRIGRIRDHVR